jgi:antitoxin Phd
MKRTWALHDAKNRLGELVNRAAEEGPQTITRHGKEVAVVVTADVYHKLVTQTIAGDIVSFLRGSPLARASIELRRVVDYGRECAL